ncbi:uncharacterized protein MELLADRAFT_70570 [Melampsora larici-populina 98AG31]|uniref:Uncharacterized protein n=1 Tax=Melampsora larici-populina (strain 98AG31 / pathotype 3-4-7) TaxID=747676 RepID=F4R2Y4_MELLP|nr:uncharacterized protein MELLADRAFT_70570 [Melampsora larici-populina 98AG31]EGG12905.1 hypothetical protein MELLADRAFT_70570 [Melampsora larici-populina 98AG31]
MFCLRYFLPILLFFPFPTAPSFLLLFFLVSMATQHRPCAYCSLLLSAILVSTCSWNIASLDVSPVYPRRFNTPFKPTSQYYSQDRKTMLYKSNDTPSMASESNPIEVDASFSGQTPPAPPVEAYELKSVHRCWFHSNIAKPFDPIWSADEYHSIRDDRSSHAPQSSSKPQLMKEGNLEDPNTVTQDKNSKPDEKVKQPRRQLNTLLSPLWSPIRRLSSIKTNEYCGEENGKDNHGTEIKDDGLNVSSNGSGSTSSDQTGTQTYYRSSFSRTPLLYTYFIRHIINFIGSYLPSLPVIYRLMSILNQNLPMLSKLSTLTEFFNPLVSVFKMIYERSFNVFRHVVDFSSNPIYVGWKDLFSIRIVLGSPPPVMMSKP